MENEREHSDTSKGGRRTPLDYLLMKKRRLDKLKTAVFLVPQAIQQRFRCDGSASVRLALFNIYLNCSTRPDLIAARL